MRAFGFFLYFGATGKRANGPALHYFHIFRLKGPGKK